MSNAPILSLITFLPLLGALLVLMVRGDDAAAKRNIRMIALFTTAVTFGLSLIPVALFNSGTAEFQFVERANWLGGVISYRMGVDGISLPLIILTTFLLPF
jgi:NADH-quinone oxidoreductase subunit M